MPKAAAARTSRCGDVTPGPLFAGVAQSGVAGPSQDGAAPEAAKGQRPPACGPNAEAGRSLARATNAEPPAPSTAVPANPPIGRLIRAGVGVFTGAPGSDPSVPTLVVELSVVWVGSEMVHLAYVNDALTWRPLAIARSLSPDSGLVRRMTPVAMRLLHLARSDPLDSSHRSGVASSRNRRERPGPSSCPGTAASPWLGSSRHGVWRAGVQLRKVHHPKIVQRSDGRWMVVCEDCPRAGEAATPVGINTPVESREMAEMLWENHCERRRVPPVRRGA